MPLSIGILGIALTVAGQIPPPALDTDPARGLKEERRAIIGREAKALNDLADRLEREKDPGAAGAVRSGVIKATDSDALTRFVPLAEVAKARKPDAPAGAGVVEAEKIRRSAAADLLALARRAATASPPHWGLASLCVREVVGRDPDQAEARRLLGFEPLDGGWARPFAIRQIRAGYVLHPTYGWVDKSWVGPLDEGKLPAPGTSKGAKKPRWLPAEEADRLRAGGNPPWQISTEHFEIRSNVPLADSIAFGRRLEAFHGLFTAVMADVIGARLPLAQRFRSPAGYREAPYRPHVIEYFATRQQYLDRLRSIAPPDIARSLGYYDPPGRGQKNARRPAYFFRDEGGEIEATATLYHEVSHQLLFETAGENAYTRNQGNYWVFEGLGTFFETVATHPDGSMEVGGFVGPRIDAAVRRIVRDKSALPTGLFVGLRQDLFNLETQVYTNYQQAQALTLLLMRGRDGAYRDGFLDYVGDALKGTLRVDSGRTLEDRLGVPYATIDAQLVDFLKARDAAMASPAGKG